MWRELFSRQTSSGLAVSEFCRREGINASLFRRWRLLLNDSAPRAAGAVRGDSAVTVAAPFIDLGGLAAVGSRFEVRLELGAGVVLSLARG
jgi:hypothetical protein